MTQANFAADIGKGVALGLKALGGAISPGNLVQGPTKEGNEKTRYTNDNIAAIWVSLTFIGGTMCSQSGPR
jgi:hypothetical protein